MAIVCMTVVHFPEYQAQAKSNPMLQGCKGTIVAGWKRGLTD